MPNSKTRSISELDIQKAVEQYLSNCLIEDEQKFNRRLKDQFDDLLATITNSLLPEGDQNREDIQQSVKKYIKAFWQRYKKRDGPKPDLGAKQLTTDFKDYFSWLTCAGPAQQTYPQAIRSTNKEIVVLNQIADAFLETKDLQGKDILIQVEFEAEYNTDKEMDRRMLHYENFVDVEQQRTHAKNTQIPERELFMQVFYLRRSPKSGANKPLVEHIERTVTAPALSAPKLVKYTAYHVYQFDLVDILQINLPFLFCFVGNMNKVTPEKIWQHEAEIRQVIEGNLTENQRQTINTILASFKLKGYYEMNKSENIDIIQQMVEVSEMYRGNEALFFQEGIQQGVQRGEEINSVKWFLRGQLSFSALVEDLGEFRAKLVQQNADSLKSAIGDNMLLLSMLEQLEKNNGE
jgi:hypothetical protein